MRKPDNLWSKLYAVHLCRVLGELDNLFPFFYYELMMKVHVVAKNPFEVDSVMLVS